MFPVQFEDVFCVVGECWAVLAPAKTSFFFFFVYSLYAERNPDESRWIVSQCVSERPAASERVAGQDPERHRQTRGQLVLQMKLYLGPWRAQRGDTGCVYLKR